MGVAILIKMMEDKRTNIFWAAYWTLKAKLLSRSSWSLVVLANILPVGVTSNQLKGEWRRALIRDLWITLDVLMMNLAKKIPFKYMRAPTTIEITEYIQIYVFSGSLRLLLLHYPSHQSLPTLDSWANKMNKNMNIVVMPPGPVKKR